MDTYKTVSRASARRGSAFSLPKRHGGRVAPRCTRSVVDARHRGQPLRQSVLCEGYAGSFTTVEWQGRPQGVGSLFVSCSQLQPVSGQSDSFLGSGVALGDREDHFWRSGSGLSPAAPAAERRSNAQWQGRSRGVGWALGALA